MNIAFPASGNAEQDAAEARRINESVKRRELGLCPNGCGPMVLESSHWRSCPSCNYGEGSTKPFPPSAVSVN